MYQEKDFDLEMKLPVNSEYLIQDLELNTLFKAMSDEDEVIFDVAKKAILNGLTDRSNIYYRQDILKDCLKNNKLVRNLYQLVIDAIEQKNQHHISIFSRSPSSILSSSINLLEAFMGMLEKLREMADNYGKEFDSEGFQQFFAIIEEQLNDQFFATAAGHLEELRFRQGTFISAELKEGNEGNNYTLLRNENHSWFEQVWSKISFNSTSSYSFSINPRDNAGFRAVSEIKDQAINLTTNTVGQAADHILGFFKKLRVELAFYIGCLNLFEKLQELGEPISFPEPLIATKRDQQFTELYDICLTLTMGKSVVGNNLETKNTNLYIITGANQGGKSTFLRSIGLAQLMMQAGMFVAAESFTANLCGGIFTHYKREEDTGMESGKFDEELNRMNEIVDNLSPNALVLFNESFASTTEREGSEIARQIVKALTEKKIKVLFVTHLYDFADSFYQGEQNNITFLRAERNDDGSRNFKIIKARPLESSYGCDLYYKIF